MNRVPRRLARKGLRQFQRRARKAGAALDVRETPECRSELDSQLAKARVDNVGIQSLGLPGQPVRHLGGLLARAAVTNLNSGRRASDPLPLCIGARGGDSSLVHTHFGVPIHWRSNDHLPTGGLSTRLRQ